MSRRSLALTFRPTDLRLISMVYRRSQARHGAKRGAWRLRGSHSMVTRSVTVLAVAASVFACASRDPEAPLRSPSYDYNREPIRLNSDGTVVGAEGKDPGDRTEEMRTGGWYVGPDGVPRYDAKRRIGGFVDKKFEAEAAERSKDRRDKK